MPIKIGTSGVTGAYVGTSRAKHIYVGTSWVYSDSRQLSITMGSGVASVSISWRTVNGTTKSSTVYSSSTINIEYGSSVTITATSSTGYTLNSYTSSLTMDANKSISITATVNAFFTNINLNNNGTEQGHIYGDKLGQMQVSTNGSTWTGYVSNEPWDSNTKQNYGSFIYLRYVSAAPGFYVGSVTYNGSTISSSGGIYTIQVQNGSYTISVNLFATTSTSSTSFNYAESITTNSLSRNGYSVSGNINIRLTSCTAGTTIGTIPYQFRPATAKTYNIGWKSTTNLVSGAVSWTNANVTIHPDGRITSDTDSTGAGSQSGGGKWGGGGISWYHQINLSMSWSVV